jgi:ketosteroid isomerase-like protein
MSQQNVEIARRLWEKVQDGVARGDPGAWFDSDAVAGDLEWILPAPLDGKSVWRGREEYVEFTRTWTDQFHDWSIRAERLIDAGDDQVVVVTHQTAIGRESGVPVVLQLWQLAHIKDGRHVPVRNYLTAAEALEAAGLSGTGTVRG